MTRPTEKKTGAAERLADLKFTLPPEQPSPPAGGEGLPAGSSGPEPEEERPQGSEIDPEEAANLVLKYADGFCTEAGLTELNTMQRLLIRMGIVGTVKKYGISLDFDKYPEFALIAGAAWVTVDKVKEYKKLHENKEELQPEKKTQPAPVPGPEATA